VLGEALVNYRYRAGSTAGRRAGTATWRDTRITLGETLGTALGDAGPDARGARPTLGDGLEAYLARYRHWDELLGALTGEFSPSFVGVRPGRSQELLGEPLGDKRSELHSTLGVVLGRALGEELGATAEKTLGAALAAPGEAPVRR
jgi:hypothetical protein